MGTARPAAPSLLAAVAAAGTAGVIGFGAWAGLLEARQFMLLALAVAGVSVVYLGWHAAPAYVFSLAIALSVFSGNWNGMGLPSRAAPDRFVLAIAVLALAFRARTSGRSLPKIESAHWALGLTALYAVGSALAVGTLTSSSGAFRLLDRLGLVPFLMFLLAPVVFRTARERAILLTTLVALGAYLSLTSLFETVGVHALVFPKYILDPNFGLHADRARGPFVEAEANGLALYGCGVAAVIAATTWRQSLPRLSAAAVAVLCAAGALFTLQRAVWIGAVLATLVTLLAFRSLRRFALVGFVALPVIVLVSFALVPGLQGAAAKRAGAERPVWDRQNLNAASIRMIEAKPLFGFGWEKFRDKNPPYFEQAADYPLTGTNQPLHNAFLSNAVELGLVGTLLWLVALGLAVGGAISRRAPPQLEPWRIGLLAYALMWAVVANFTPLERPFVSILLMTWAGVVWAGRHGGARDEAA
jgi:putative inorganic carbon (HCO3(-)) transporter